MTLNLLVIARAMDAPPPTRSSLATVRNPITSLESFERLATLPPEAREALRAILGDMATDARARADKCWRTHKAPMATYWKGVSVYAGHIRRALRSPT